MRYLIDLSYELIRKKLSYELEVKSVIPIKDAHKNYDTQRKIALIEKKHLFQFVRHLTHQNVANDFLKIVKLTSN